MRPYGTAKTVIFTFAIMVRMTPSMFIVLVMVQPATKCVCVMIKQTKGFST